MQATEAKCGDCVIVTSAVLILFLVFSLPVTASSEATTELSTGGGNDTNGNDDPGCQAMQDSQSHVDKGILCVGRITKQRLLVVTKDWYIYVLPLTSLDGTIGKLYVNSTKPRALKDLWPALYNHKRWAHVVEHLLDAFVWTMPDGRDMFYTELIAPDVGLSYNLEDGTVGGGYISYMDVRNFVIICEFQTTVKYMLYVRNSDSQFAIQQCELHVENHDELLCGDVTGYFCKATESTVHFQQGVCDHPVDWPQISGTIINGLVYLFGPKFVISFKASVFQTKGDVVVNIARWQYSNFVHCKGKIAVSFDPDVSPDGTKTSPVLWGIIAAVVLILVLCVLCILLFLMFNAFGGDKKKKRKKNTNGKQSKKGTSSRLRSGALHGPGRLSSKGKRQGSVRSTALRGHGKISAKGSKARPSRATKGNRGHSSAKVALPGGGGGGGGGGGTSPANGTNRGPNSAKMAPRGGTTSGKGARFNTARSKRTMKAGGSSAARGGQNGSKRSTGASKRSGLGRH